MSDMEEPPTKVLKMDVTASSLDSTMEGQEEGQEEWLSEGVLTDDDYMVASSSQELPTDANAAESTQSPEQEPQQDSQAQANIAMDQNIEETLNNFEGMETSTKSDQHPGSTMVSMEPAQESQGQLEAIMQQSIENALNDLGVQTANKEPIDAVPESQEPRESGTMQRNIEDTLNHFERMEDKEDGVNELLKKAQKHSEPSPSEHSDDGHNTDELLRMLGEDDSKKKKVLTTIREKNARRAARSSEDDFFLEGAKVTKLKVAKNAIIRKQPMRAEPEDFSDRDSDMSEDEESTVKRMFTSKPRPTAGRALKSSSSYTNIKTEKPTPTPVKQYTNNSQNKSMLKPKVEEHPEIINEEEFLEDDDFDLDDDVGDEWRHVAEETATKKMQPIRRPERMDEEVPSDDDSHSEDDSLYDVMPSSDSEDMDDWFTLDIRAERAGDYLPWLGDKAHKLLTEEKHRVSSRLAALRQSVTALQSSGRVQSDQIKVATEALHELDAMLAAA